MALGLSVLQSGQHSKKKTKHLLASRPCGHSPLQRVRANSSKESSHSTTSLDVEGKILQNQTSLMPPSGGPKQNSGPTNSGNQQGTKVLVGIVVVFFGVSYWSISYTD